MIKTIKIIVLATLCLNFKVEAQLDKPAHRGVQSAAIEKIISPLNIGDAIPEAMWNIPLQVVNHPEGKRTITLNDYKHKLIILDFWATYCHPCIRSIQKLDSISGDFIADVIVIPVQVYDTEDRILPFLKKTGFNWYSVINDTVLNKIAFSKYITGFGNVWIYKGKLLAVPTPISLTRSNILAVLNGRQPEIVNRIKQKK